MCLFEVDVLDKKFLNFDIDLEPRMPTAYCTSGKLIAVKAIPACPGFRHLTLRELDGKGVEVVVPISMLVYVFCQGIRPKSEPRNRNLPT